MSDDEDDDDDQLFSLCRLRDDDSVISHMFMYTLTLIICDRTSISQKINTFQ